MVDDVAELAHAFVAKLQRSALPQQNRTFVRLQRAHTTFLNREVLGLPNAFRKRSELTVQMQLHG